MRFQFEIESASEDLAKITTYTKDDWEVVVFELLKVAKKTGPAQLARMVAELGEEKKNVKEYPVIGRSDS